MGFIQKYAKVDDDSDNNFTEENDEILAEQVTDEDFIGHQITIQCL